MSFSLVALLFFGCANEEDDQPVAIDEVVSEIFDYTSDVQVGDHIFKMETKLEVRVNGQGELVSSQVLSKTIDGMEMETINDGRWSIAISLKTEQRTQSESETPFPGDEDCETETTLIAVVNNPLHPLAPGLCVYNEETTCYRSGYDSDGVLTTIITVDDNLAFGACNIWLQ